MKAELLKIADFLHNKNSGLKIEVIKIWRDKRSRVLLLSALFFNFIAWLIGVFINQRVEDKVIALHHNIYFGITLIGSAKQVYFIPALGFIIITLNLIFSHIAKEEKNFFIYVFAASSLLASIFIILGLSSIMLINFR
ncbi:hypothetical protein COT99_03195 [Candidatus Falkowbacteria bacterium CG10_big_fil_rev_8_21_14_0_10_43_10]|uniref:Uncharacterized protein n=1 Tax=Candidatus Falkowbacteria bacterium CG10_big_fil_rev_8_21_14_0_10_43_10 TaxID=1974567 RepID=A0A2H0V1P3_9BACT|nr:MAG: hypothetical protein COT99_03195 [Candidatus Falkowbacteria bacterium CG10_big_fil_rev_8_21_14_0_10_43_10]